MASPDVRCTARHTGPVGRFGGWSAVAIGGRKRLVHDLAHRPKAQLVGQLQGPGGIPGLKGGLLDHRRVDPLVQHFDRLGEERCEDARGEEAPTVVDDDRILPNRQHEVDGLRQGLVRGLLASDDLDGVHLDHR